MQKTKRHLETIVNHERIRELIEESGGYPGRVKREDLDAETEASEGDKNSERVLWIDFGDNEHFEPLGWEEFFDSFEHENLALLYHEDADDQGHLFEFVDRDQLKQ